MAAPEPRLAVVRDALGIGVAVGAFGLSYGAVSTAAGLSVAQTCALSVLMFTGASQFALVGVVGAGGSALAAALTALLLGSRNALYGLRLVAAPARPGRAPGRGGATRDRRERRDGPRPRHGRLLGDRPRRLRVLERSATAAGAIGGAALADPRALGLDAAGPAAFLALLAPRLDGRAARRLCAHRGRRGRSSPCR